MAQFNGFKDDYTGLSGEKIRSHQEKYGANQLVPETKASLVGKVLGIFKEPMFLLLFFTAILYFFLGEPRDGVIMLCFVAFMSGINIFQEWRTDKTLEALKDLSSPKVKVVRNSQLITIDSRELTVDDLMILEEGDKVSADGQILEMFDLGVDESTLTGESDVVWKKTQLDESEKDSHWRKDFCYAGTMVTQGSAIIKVTHIGTHTEYGKIGQDLASIPHQTTPLEKQTSHLIKVCALISIAMFAFVFLVNYQHSLDIVNSILAGITLAMAMIPEEFPVILTVFLAMGAWRLAKKNSLIRQMPSVQTLGAVSILCVDKTGTLTKNQMSIQRVYPFNGHTEDELAYWAGLGCETQPYDPMEKAILSYLKSKGMDLDHLFSRDLLQEYPFSSETKMMGHIWEIDQKPALAAKGSPESILPLCHLTRVQLEKIIEAQEKLASQGYRVIAVASKSNMDNIPDRLEDNELNFVGLIGLADPPRETVPEAIRVCSKAGIRVVMITGDNGITAKSIARQIGIPNYDNVITGQELELMSDEELRERVKTNNIFARVIPRHKMRIVKAFKDNEHIVAMTGDGVNDAPALKYSDIGIAMGKRGTGVAKEAADMILLDDNFTTIVDTVRDGRRIYDNIKKAIGYVFVIHIPIALAALLTPILHLPMLLLPIHIVLLELIIDPTCSIIFERQPAEENIMERKPRSSKEALVSTKLMWKSVLQGFSIFGAAFAPYVYMIREGYPQNIARTFSLSVFMLANLFLVYVNQSERSFAWTGLLKYKDKVLLYINAAILASLLLVIYLPAANTIAKTAALSATQLLTVFLLSWVSTCWWEIIKLIKRVKERMLYVKSSISR